MPSPVTLSFASGLPAAVISRPSPDGNVIPVLNLYVKGLTVLTTGVPADLGSITVPLPAGTRWRIVGAGTSSSDMIYAETAAGTLAAASFVLMDGAGGTGTTLTSATAGPNTAGNFTTPGSSNAVSTSSAIYLRQTVASANAGTVSLYVAIAPLP